MCSSSSWLSLSIFSARPASALQSVRLRDSVHPAWFGSDSLILRSTVFGTYAFATLCIRHADGRLFDPSVDSLRHVRLRDSVHPTRSPSRLCASGMVLILRSTAYSTFAFATLCIRHARPAGLDRPQRPHSITSRRATAWPRYLSRDYSTFCLISRPRFHTRMTIS
jgi:hypothetical protein